MFFIEKRTKEQKEKNIHVIASDVNEVKDQIQNLRKLAAHSKNMELTEENNIKFYEIRGDKL